MGKSEWDKNLRDMLGDFKSEGEPPHWEEFAQQLDSRLANSEDPNLLEDQNLKETLSNYLAPGQVEGWDRIQASLDEANREFDENVRKKIKHYGPQYDPLSWPVFLQRLSDSRLLRTKLIIVKSIEFAAILLILLTVVNIGRMGRLPFESPGQDREEKILPTETKPVDKAYLETQNNNSKRIASSSSTSALPSDPSAIAAKKPIHINDHTLKSTASSTIANLHSSALTQKNSTPTQSVVIASNSDYPVDATFSETAIITSDIVENPPVTPLIETATTNQAVNALAIVDQPPIPLNQAYITEGLSSVNTNVERTEVNTIPKPTFVAAVSKTILEFGIMSQVDYNRLRMPEDRLSSAGKQIIFPQQGIPSYGYGGGFTFALSHPLWAIESGIIYSAKNFKPGREAIVGGAFDNASVEFQAMRLQLVSLPFQLRYRFEHKGRLKAYAIGGLGLHVIAQSNIDVLIKYNFSSLAAGENPNSKPSLAPTIAETRRIREHIRDGAPFSTKSFVSVNAGLGLEYALAPRNTLFFQAVCQYQIPDLEFSNNNGKHIRSLSLQAGVRTPLDF